MDNPVLGMDVSKRTLDCVLLDDGKAMHRQVSNDRTGLRRLATWLKSREGNDTLICMEATGSLWEDAATFLYQGGWRVAVVNPKFIKHFAMGAHARTKTDRYDARVIAEYARRMDLTLWTPPTPERIELRQCMREVQALIKTRAQEKNRLASGQLVQAVQDTILHHIAYLDQAIADLEAHIQARIEQHPEMQRDVDLLLTIPGVGRHTTWLWIAELGDCTQFDDARQLAAFLGLTPMQRESGSSLNAPARLCKMGNRRLRQALYFPAIAAKRHNPIIRPFAERLARNHKPKKCIIGACMRKLVHLIYAILKAKRPFDPSFATNTH